MGDQNLTSIERVARQICKVLRLGSVASLEEIRDRLLTKERVRHAAPKWHHERQPKEGDFARAIELAVSSGWIRNDDGTIALTQAGSELGRRSRVGRRKVRVAF